MDVTQQRTTVDALLGRGAGTFDMLQFPELVKLKGAVFVVSWKIWGFAGNPFYKNAKRYAAKADRMNLAAETKNQFFPKDSISQEQAWYTFLLADAPREAIYKQDGEPVHALVDALLLRFRNIIELAQLANGNEIKEITAAQTFQLKVETAGLIRAAEDLMSLTRELKEMWLFGPLRKLNEGEASASDKMTENAMAVANLLDELSKKAEDRKPAVEEMEEGGNFVMEEEEDVED